MKTQATQDKVCREEGTEGHVVSTNDGTVYNVDRMDQFASQIAAFLGCRQDAARQRLEEIQQVHGLETAVAWKAHNPVTPAEVTRFYERTESYIFDLAADHSRTRREVFWSNVVKRIEAGGAGQRVLMYGDGIGTDSLDLACRGHAVTYFDLPSRTSEFARFRFNDAGMSERIGVVESIQEAGDGQFDAVVSIEVLEHVPDPLDVMKQMYRVLRVGGIALITESFDAVGPDYPSHLPENAKFAGRTHRLMECLGFANTYNCPSPVNRPMEFTKVGHGVLPTMKRLRGRVRRVVTGRVRTLCRRWSSTSVRIANH